MSTIESKTTDALVGYAFPLIVVKYYGPTDARGSRYVATLKRYGGMSEGTVIESRRSAPFRYDMGTSEQSMALVRECWARYIAPGRDGKATDDVARVFVPCDMANGDTGYVVVPASVLTVSA
jgi:hypothetical protein